MVRLNADGSRDVSFSADLNANANPGETVSVKDFAQQPDGKIIVWVSYRFYIAATNLFELVRSDLFRLNTDGTLDRSFNIMAFEYAYFIKMLLQPDSKVLVAGRFRESNGSTVNNVFRLHSNGVLDSSFNSKLGDSGSGLIISLTQQDDGKILIGGGFRSVNSSAPNFIARLNVNGSLDTSFAPNFSGLPSDIGTAFAIRIAL